MIKKGLEKKMMIQKELEQRKEISLDVGSINPDYENYCEIEKEEKIDEAKQGKKSNLFIRKLFDCPKIIGIVGNPNEAKSNTIYYLISELRKEYKFDLHYFGLRNKIKGKELNSIKQLEQIKNSILVLDEFNTLLNLQDRTKRRQIENSLRMIHHNNNILIISGTGENFKKFISGKVEVIIFKKIFYDALINGSSVKKVIQDYQDIFNIKGSSVLNLNKNQALVYDGDYNLIAIPYMKEFDTKKENVEILLKKSCKNVEKK